MQGNEHAARFESTGDVEPEGSTVLVGLPGLGLAGLIAVDHVVDALGLEARGRLVSERFPRVATFAGGRTRDAVRAYALEESTVTAVQADLLFPPRSHEALANGVVEHLTGGCDRVVVPIGAPADTADQHGEVTEVASTDSLEAEVRDAGVAPAQGVGAIGGPSGAVVTTCDRAGVPTVALIVRTEPYRPDPAAARALLTDGLDPLVGFDIDTTDLDEELAALEAEMEEMARQMQRLERRDGFAQVPPEMEPSMFQ